MDLEEFYNSITLETLGEFIQTKREEDLFLDFKLAPRGLDKETKKNFAKALSGFANSSGGLVIWGIDARKVQGIDVASVLEPIKELKKFINGLNSFTGQYVSPIVDGVRHVEIPINENSGYVKTLIPQSQSGPHMAMAGENRYYKRSGDSFYKLEHFDIADMFGQRPKPDLKFFATIVKKQRPEIEILVGIGNHGKGLARFPYLSIEVNQPYKISKLGLDRLGKTGIPRVTEHGMNYQKQSFGGSSDIVIYPGGSLDVTKILLDDKHVTEDTLDLEINYVLCCENHSLISSKFKMSGKKLQFNT